MKLGSYRDRLLRASREDTFWSRSQLSLHTTVYLFAMRVLMRREVTTRFLEVGCGDAILCKEVRKLGVAHIIGMDFDDAHLALARKNVPEGKFLWRDILEKTTRFSADVVAFPNVLGYFTLAQLQDVLQRTTAPWVLLNVCVSDCTEKVPIWIGAEYRLQAYPQSQYEQVFRQSGYTVDNCMLVDWEKIEAFYILRSSK